MAIGGSKWGEKHDAEKKSDNDTASLSNTAAIRTDEGVLEVSVQSAQ